jgi:hypothetical protein
LKIACNFVLQPTSNSGDHSMPMTVKLTWRYTTK